MKSFAKRESLMGERGSLNSRSSWEIGAVICGNALLLWFCRPLFCYLLAKYYTRLFINDNDLFKYLKVIKKIGNQTVQYGRMDFKVGEINHKGTTERKKMVDFSPTTKHDIWIL